MSWRSLQTTLGGLLLGPTAAPPAATTETFCILGEETTCQVRRSLLLRSILRFCYRRGFLLEPYNITSDAGWGCMIRCAQMMMAQAYRLQVLGHDWTCEKGDLESLRGNADYCNLLNNFLDFPGPPHVYSIHHIVVAGFLQNKLPGEWFGAHSIALVMRHLANLHYLSYEGEIQVLVTQGPVIYLDEVEKLCSQKRQQSAEPSPNFKKDVGDGDDDDDDDDGEMKEDEEDFFDPLLRLPPVSTLSAWRSALVVLLPLRLGEHRIGSEFIPELAQLLRSKNCIGFLGGTPGRALYVVGTTSSGGWVCLDPHSVAPHPSLRQPFPSQALFDSIHKEGDVRIVDPATLDPSLTLGYWFASKEEFVAFCEEHTSSTLFQIQTFSREATHSSLEDAETDDDEDEYVIV